VGCGFRNQAKSVNARKGASQPPLYPLLVKEGNYCRILFFTLMQSSPDQEDFKQARALAYRYLSIRDRTERETADYLGKKGFDTAVVQQTLHFLKDANYLNDRRFAEHWARTRAENKQFGKYRLRQELTGKGLDTELIDETLDTLFDNVKEIDLARAVVEKKLRSMQDLEPEKRKRRLAGLLQRKGFSSDIIYKVLD